MRPAVPRASAYAHVVNATDVGNTPRYAIHAMLEPGAARKSRTRAGAYGRQTSAPMVQHTHVTCSAGSRPSVDATLRFVEDDAVQAKPQEAGDQQESYVAPRGPSPSTGQEQGA